MFWGGILLAERRFSAEFDWRYMTLSTLISPHRNPNGYVWAAGGLVLSALSALLWAVALARRWNEVMGDRPRGIWLLEWGSVCMVGSVMLPWRLPRLPKEHEVLTLFAFAGLCLGMIRLGYQTAQAALRRRTVGSAGRVRLYGAGFAGLAVLPIFLAGVAEAYVYYVLPQLHWVSLAWRDRGVPVYLSFAFWEWITCAVLSVYMTVLSVAAQASGQERKVVG